VFVTRALPGGALSLLEGRVEVDLWRGPGAPPADVLARGAASAQGLLCLLTDSIDARLIESCRSLRVISSCSVGLDHVDLAAATARGIPVGYTPGVLTETTADLAFALLLTAARRVAEGDRFVRGGSWTPQRSWEPDLLLGRDVHGATLGIVGLGEIGCAMARRARGFGMRVLGCSRRRRDVEGLTQVNLEELLGASAFVTLHVAQTPETLGLIDAAALARMPRGAVLVNTSRGGIVDEGALVEALRSGHLAAAGLDVYAEEPLPLDSPLLQLENVVLTPHIGSASVETRTRMAELAVENLLAGLEGRPLPRCANRQVQRRPET
jgi:glyoxylate reductase